MNAMQVSNAVRCLFSVVFLVTCITSTLTQAASYQKTDGTIVDPILDTFGSPHGYSGVNLESHANLTGAELRFSNLYRADLTDANLNDANLTNADLANATLTGARLAGETPDVRLSLRIAVLTTAGEARIERWKPLG